jgi:hypothetical protein
MPVVGGSQVQGFKARNFVWANSHPGLPPRGEGEWFDRWLDGLDDRGEQTVARKSARGLPQYRTLIVHPKLFTDGEEAALQAFRSHL